MRHDHDTVGSAMTTDVVREVVGVMPEEDRLVTGQVAGREPEGGVTP